MPLSTTALAPVSATIPAMPIGQTVLIIGVQGTMGSGIFGAPYLVGSARSALDVFGSGPLVQGIGELIRQRAPAIVAVAIAQIGDLSAVLDALVDIPVSIITMTGVPTTTDIISTLAVYAYTREQLGQPVTIVAGVDPSPGVTTLVGTSWGVAAGYSPSTPTNIIFGRYFIFTLDELIVNPNLPSQYKATAAVSVAGRIAASDPSSSVTYAPLWGVDLVGGYSSIDCASLSNAGYTVLTNTTRHGVVIYGAVTGTSISSTDANYSPNYHRLSTLRIAQYVVSVIQGVTQSQIGEPSKGTMQQTIDTTINSLITQGMILAGSGLVTVNQLAGTISVDLTILPPYETTAINVTTQVRIL